MTQSSLPRTRPLTPSDDNITYGQEALRKATHFVALLIPAIYIVFPQNVAVAIMAAAFVSIAIFEFSRFRNLLLWRVLRPVVGPMIRPKEQNGNFTGAFYILLSGLVAIICFPRYVAATAITFEILGDVASALIGRRYGRRKIRGYKTVEGTAGFLVVAILIIIVVPEIPYSVGIIGAITASIVEAISIHRDDNLTVPLSSGLVMYLLMTLFPTLP